MIENKLKVIAIETTGPVVDIGSDVCKSLPPGRRYRYKQSAIYTLENGEKIAGERHGMTKPKLFEEIKRFADNVSRGMVSAVYVDGKYFGLSLSITLR